LKEAPAGLFRKTEEAWGQSFASSGPIINPFTIQAFCLRAVNRILQAGRTKITVADIEAIKDSVLAEVMSIRGERAGTSLPASLNEALARLSEAQARIATLQAELAKVEELAGNGGAT